VNWILERAAEANHVDLEAWETALRCAVLQAGAGALQTLLDGIGSGPQVAPVLCGCGSLMESRGREDKDLLTVLGPVAYRRSRYVCPDCGESRYPGEEALDVVGTTRSPGVRRLMARAGSKTPFKEAREDLLVYAGLSLSAKDVERVAEQTGEAMGAWNQQERAEVLARPPLPTGQPPIPILYISYDGTGIPMTRRELAGRRGKQPDGSARTREAKLGCVFTQTTVDAEGYPVRDPDSTSFVGAIENAEDFGWRIYAEAVRRGIDHAQRVVVLGDGAVWIKGTAEMHFPGATQIVDLYHARQHVATLAKLLFPDQAVAELAQRRLWWDDLDAGAVEKIMAEARVRLPRRSQRRHDALKEIGYLDKNRDRMRYAEFRRQHLFVGSGVIEAGCKTVIGQRMKQSGMEWSMRGANAILTLRCTMLSGRQQDYWESRAA